MGKKLVVVSNRVTLKDSITLVNRNIVLLNARKVIVGNAEIIERYTQNCFTQGVDRVDSAFASNNYMASSTYAMQVREIF